MFLQLGLEQARKEARGVVVNIPIDFYQYLLNNEHEYLRDNHTYKFGDFLETPYIFSEICIYDRPYLSIWETTPSCIFSTGKTFNGGAKSKQKGDATTSGISQG